MLEHEIGVVCGQCDTYSAMDKASCPQCGSALDINPISGDSSQQEIQQGRGVLDQEGRMEQARHYVCPRCSTPVPSGHKFCGNCGAEVPVPVQQMQTDYFGAMQVPGKARLLVVRGQEGIEGVSYGLSSDTHGVGSVNGQILFPNDNWVSPTHATFFYDQGKLWVRDEGSINGVYLRVREPVPVTTGDYFLCGEQVFRIDHIPSDQAGPDSDMTYFYVSPKRPSAFRVVQILEGGLEGIVYCARGNQVRIGREDNDLNFAEDIFMSGNHAIVQMVSDGKFSLVDNSSKNGTYIRLRDKQELRHGDYVFIGHQLLRVELTS
ncbi:MAG: FHA domain-containing protein [Myxococcales bacterium]|nr:MAG: FHA domain-containing protein [Myxococcales bacterium]